MEKWIKGLLAAVISSAGQGLVAYVSVQTFDPRLFEDGDFWKVLGAMVGFNVLKTVGAYFAQSPIQQAGPPVNYGAGHWPPPPKPGAPVPPPPPIH